MQLLEVPLIRVAAIDLLLAHGYDEKLFHHNRDEGHMSGWYELSVNDKGQYSFVLKAGNNEIILRSETYQTKASAENGIASVQQNSPLDERYERKDASDGRPFFNLLAANHQVIGTSQLYQSAANRAVGIDSVKANGATATIKLID